LNRIRWAKKATEQFAASYDFLAAENPSAAAKQADVILRAVRQLVNFPEMGRIGRVSHTRELVIAGTPYVVAYRLKSDIIRILALLHGARRWPKHF
jgi:toxin ParE1/3/4